MNRSMRKTVTSLKMLLVLLVATVSLSSCEADDFWYRDTIEGSWRVVEVRQDYGYCPYRYGDVMYFAFDGGFEMSGRDGSVEYGNWTLFKGRVLVDFDFDGIDDLSARIVQMDDGYAVLDCKDYYYNSRYSLRMIRY